MNEKSIRMFDRVKYGTVPQLSAYGYLRLIRDLQRVKPANAPELVEKAFTRMVGTGEELRGGVEARVEGGGEPTSFDFVFDVLVDKMWNDAGNELEHRARYADPVLATLPKERRDAIDLDHRIEVAAAAREVQGQLFGEGTSFLQAGFPLQAEQMAVRLDIIKKSPKAALYQELLGEGLFNTLTVLQEHYDDMVHGRVMRQKTNSAVRELRFAAQRHITVYASAVMLMLDEDEPSTLKLVEDALTPIPAARVRRDSASPTEVEGADEGEPADPAPANGEDVEKTVVDP